MRAGQMISPAFFSRRINRMSKVRKILVAVDFSENSKNTLKYAYEFFKGCGIEFHVVHVVYEALPEGSYIPHTSVGEMGKTSMDYATEELDKFIPLKIMSSGEEIHKAVLEGPPYSTIIEYAQKNGLELIVMGSQGASGLAKFLLGSVTDKVIRQSPIPVLVVKP
jgi:nucleotide-binding universal stress UspA family protein